MSKRKDFKGLIIIGGIAGIALLGTLYNQYLNRLPQDYTVGEIIKVYKPAKGNTRVKFSYSVQDKRYEGSESNYGHEKTAKPGKRFLVEYPEGHEDAGIMLLDYPVPDGAEAPSEGWSEKPDF